MGADSTIPVRGRYLIFHVAEQAYAVPIASVEEIVPMAELSQLPAAPSFLVGFLDVDGQLVAVISLRRLFDLPETQRGLYTPIIILKSEHRPCALEVDAVSHIADIAHDDAISISEGCSLNEFAIAVANLEGTMVLILSPDRMLLDQENRRMTDLAEQMRQRIAALESVSA